MDVLRAVSASDLRKYDGQEPLQDNGELAVLALCSRLPFLSKVIAKPWVRLSPVAGIVVDSPSNRCTSEATLDSYLRLCIRRQARV